MAHPQQKKYPQKIMRKLEEIAASIGLDPKQNFKVHGRWITPVNWLNIRDVATNHAQGMQKAFLDLIINQHNILVRRYQKVKSEKAFYNLVLLAYGFVKKFTVDGRLVLEKGDRQAWEHICSLILMGFFIL